MLYFRNDYSEGAHASVMNALVNSNLDRTPGYGEDMYCAAARDAIRREIGNENASVFFISGGTQTNLIMISAALRPHEAVISVASGHINTHESGAIEATGHKVLAYESADGKMTPDIIDAAIAAHPNASMVKPKMVYISDATEWGTLYTKAELAAISACCKAHDLYLYLDGARLGSALTATGNDLTLTDIAALVDCFYIGGTKNGLLFGEALVILNPHLSEDLTYMIKQRGALLAKGRLLGVQFQALFTDGLFYEIGRHENAMARRLHDALAQLGYRFYVDSPTNQLFPYIRNENMDALTSNCACEVMFEGLTETCIRFVTSWATTEGDVEELIRLMKTLK